MKNLLNIYSTILEISLLRPKYENLDYFFVPLQQLFWQIYELEVYLINQNKLKQLFTIFYKFVPIEFNGMYLRLEYFFIFLQQVWRKAENSIFFGHFKNVFITNFERYCKIIRIKQQFLVARLHIKIFLFLILYNMNLIQGFIRKQTNVVGGHFSQFQKFTLAGKNHGSIRYITYNLYV